MAGRRHHTVATPEHPRELPTWSPNLLSDRTPMIPHQFAQTSTGRNNGNESTTWSPQLLEESATKIPRRLVKIPSDQAAALENASIWGRAYVQPQVLEQAEARYSAEFSKPQEQRTFSSRPQSQDEFLSQPATPAPPSRIASEEIMSGTDKYRSVQDEEDEKPPMSSASWASSPPEHFINPRLPPARELESSPAGPNQQLIDQQLVERQTVQSKQNPYAPKLRLQSPLLVEFAPGSSQTTEAGVEVEEAVRPVAGRAQEPPALAPLAALVPPDPTPPSAQIIPATLPRAESPSPERVVKRPRLMKDITQMFPSPAHADRRQSTTLSAEKSASYMLSRPTGSGDGSTHASESSSYETQPPEEPSPITATPIVPRAARSQTLADQVKIITATPANIQQPQSSRSSDKPPPNKTLSQDPYTMFAEDYPDYEGTLNMFIRAVISLEEQQRRKLLNEFLYDDYVRVFSGPYLDYIRACDEEGVENPDTTIQWYNTNVRRPVYMKSHLTEAKVKEILRYYPDLVCKIRDQVRGVGSNSLLKRRQETTIHVVKGTPQPPRSSRRTLSSPSRNPSTERLTRKLPSRPSPQKPPPVIIDREEEEQPAQIHRAELASDPIVTTQDYSPVAKSRYRATRESDMTPNFRSSVGTGTAHRISGDSVQSTGIRDNGRSSTPQVTPSGFQTQVAHPSLDIESSAPVVVEDTVMIIDDDDEDDVDDDMQEITDVQTGEHQRHSAEPNEDKRPSTRVGVKRPWEEIDDPQVRAEVQLRYWKVFLEKVYMPSRALFFEQAEEVK